MISRKQALIFSVILTTPIYATSFAPGDFQEIGNSIHRFEQLPVGSNPELQTDILKDLIGKYKKTHSIEPKPIRPDALGGCVSHTTCTGEGKDKVCTTWEVCLNSDDEK